MNRRWVIRGALLLPAVVIAVLAGPRFMIGLSLEKAFPAAAYIETDNPLSLSAYRQVADLLSSSPTGDSDTVLLQTEAAIDSGTPPKEVIGHLENALAKSPFSARGWIIFASLLTETEPRKAAMALTLSFDLAPREYYLTLPRTLVAAPLWNYLPSEVRITLLSDIRAMANDQDRREQLRLILSRPGGADLLVRSFAARPDRLRELNREFARDRLRL